MSDNYGQSLVNDADTLLEGTWEYDNSEYLLKCRNISYKDMRRVQQYGALAASVSAIGDQEEIGENEIEVVNQQADKLEDFSWEDNGGEDWIASVVDEKLVKPEVDIEETSSGKLRALVEGMLSTWRESSAVKNAKAEMRLEEQGN